MSITVIDAEHLLARIVNLEQQVANQVVSHSKFCGRLTAVEDVQMSHTDKLARSVELKSQAAQQQATDHLYAPLRNDTRAVIDMAAFVRKVANCPVEAPVPAWDMLRNFIIEAQEILKRST